jgi:hypothetical protein
MYTDDLKDLLRLTRVGRTAVTKRRFPSDMPLQARMQQLVTAINDGGIKRLSDDQLLQFRTLDAEFEYAFGLHHTGEASKRLMALCSALRARLDDWNRGNLDEAFGEHDDAPSLRSKIWALMADAFYGDYAAGRVSDADKALSVIERLIDSELLPLQGQGYQAHGTRARLHEFQAQCVRALRRFSDAHRHFLAAQTHIDARLAEKWHTASASAREVEQQFAIIATARVLAGLGRLALVQGQLHRALQMLRSSHTLLMPSGNEVLRTIVESHIAIAARRSATPGSREWKESLARLVQLWERFRGPKGSQSGDVDGMLRCSHEISLALLEYAELLTPAARIQWLASAQTWRTRLERLAKADGARRDAALYRAGILRALHAVLSERPDSKAAFQELRTCDAAQRRTPACHLDLAGCDCLDIRLVRALALTVSASSGEGRGRRAESYFVDLQRDATNEGDVELEAEALIRAAAAESNAGRLEAATTRLSSWHNLSSLIENAFLLALHERVQDATSSQPIYLFAMSGLTADLKSARLFLIKWARAKYGTNKGAARALRVNSSVVRDALAPISRQRRPGRVHGAKSPTK